MNSVLDDTDSDEEWEDPQEQCISYTVNLIRRSDHSEKKQASQYPTIHQFFSEDR